LSDDPDLPFGHNTLKLRAVFIPDGADVSMADIIQAVGPHPVLIRAVWVPPGGAMPGYPYEHIGQAVFIPDDDDRDTPAFTNRQNPLRMSHSAVASLSTPSRTDDQRAQEDSASDGRRSSGSLLASAAGPWAPASGNGSSGGAARRRGVRSAQANFSAAVPTPHVDGSRDAIDAAMRSLAVKPSDGTVSIVADRTTLADRPIPQAGAAQSTDDPDAAKRKLQSARLQAMLRLIRSAENQDDGNRESDYHRLAGDPPGGSGSIPSLDHHPGREVDLTIQGRATRSSAAGAYQITEPTWNEAIRVLQANGTPVTDFSVPSQNKVATQIIRNHHALDLVLSGNLEQAVARLRGTGVSLPDGSQQARGLDIGEARRRFDRYVTEYLAGAQ
jgi:muramidase (phage lysozyme)